MKKIITVLIVCLACIMSVFAGCRADEGPVVADSSLSVMTEEEAVALVKEKYPDDFAKYDDYNATYLDDETWRITCYDDAVTCDGEHYYIIDEHTKEITVSDEVLPYRLPATEQ